MQRKSFEIPKTLVWASYLDVRRNKGAPGCDGQTLKMFDQQRDGNLYKSRMTRECHVRFHEQPGSEILSG